MRSPTTLKQITNPEEHLSNHDAYHALEQANGLLKPTFRTSNIKKSTSIFRHINILFTLTLQACSFYLFQLKN